MSEFTPVRRAQVIAHARRWIGTPYHHQASRLGVGVDCIGLVRGVWRALYGTEPETLPGYGRDWSEATGRETLLEAARRHFVPIPPASAEPGDLLVFRYRPRTVAKHVGIVAEPAGVPDAHGVAVSIEPVAAGDGPRFNLIHAIEGAPVSEVALIGWWRRRIAAAFSFPGIID